MKRKGKKQPAILILCILCVFIALICAGCADSSGAPESPESENGNLNRTADHVNTGAADQASNQTNSVNLAYTDAAETLMERVKKEYGGDIKFIRSGSSENACHALMDGSANIILTQEPDAVIWAEIDDGGFAWDMTALAFDSDQAAFIYVITDAELPEDSPAKALYHWFFSEAGQNMIQAIYPDQAA